MKNEREMRQFLHVQSEKNLFEHLLTDREIVQQIGHSLFRDNFSVWIVIVFEARFGSRAWFGNYPHTPFSFVLCFNLPILASPRVLHREQRRKIPSACMGVRGRFYTPTDTQRTWPGWCLCEKRSRNGTNLPQSCSWRSGPLRPLRPDGALWLCRRDSVSACSRAGCRPS